MDSGCVHPVNLFLFLRSQTVSDDPSHYEYECLFLRGAADLHEAERNQRRISVAVMRGCYAEFKGDTFCFSRLININICPWCVETSAKCVKKTSSVFLLQLRSSGN